MGPHSRMSTSQAQQNVEAALATQTAGLESERSAIMAGLVQGAKDRGMNPLKANGYEFLHSRMSTSQAQQNVEAALATQTAGLESEQSAKLAQGATITIKLRPTKSYQS